MTTSPVTETPDTVVVDASASERLAQLHAEFFAAKEAEDAAKARRTQINDAIKAELSAQIAEGITRVELRGPGGAPLRMSQSERWTVDSKKLKSEAPEIYVRFARKSVSWGLTAVAGGGSQ